MIDLVTILWLGRIGRSHDCGVFAFVRSRLTRACQHCLDMQSYFDLGQTLTFPKSAAGFSLDHTQMSITVPRTYMFQIKVPLC